MNKYLCTVLIILGLMVFGCSTQPDNNAQSNSNALPDNFIPDRCSFSMPLSCNTEDVVVNENSVSIEIKNMLSYGVVLQNIEVSTDSCSDYKSCFDKDNDNTCNEKLNEVKMDSNEKKKFLIVCNSGFNNGDIKFTVDYEWYSQEASAMHAKPSSGDVLINAE
ncbi:MAG: hypothetical protein ACQERU_13635 [Bacteroidota bacterium]